MLVTGNSSYRRAQGALGGVLGGGRRGQGAGRRSAWQLQSLLEKQVPALRRAGMPHVGTAADSRAPSADLGALGCGPFPLGQEVEGVDALASVSL